MYSVTWKWSSREIERLVCSKNAAFELTELLRESHYNHATATAAAAAKMLM